MELVSVRIEKYRSIRHPAEMTFDGLKVLIGANNRGKSNILNAIRLGMETLEQASIPMRLKDDDAGLVLERRSGRRPYARISARVARRFADYDWHRDFPVHLRGSGKYLQESKIRFSFRLSEQDRRDFYRRCKVRNGGDLAVEIIFDSKETRISFPKRGGSSYHYSAQSICQFICSRLKFLYIPAIRTADQAAEVIEQLIAEQLSTLESNQEYVQLGQRIQEIQADRLAQVSEKLESRMKTYLPGFKQLMVKTDERRTARLSATAVDDINIDDGVLTSLLEKGDGVKSLVTLALLHDLAERGPSSQEVLLAIDEPEAHLHPEAIHEMSTVLKQIAKDKPVVIATHSQMLINRERLGHNFIVDDDSLAPVNRISQIRECLAIRPFDNLTTAEFVVLTEGPTDAEIIGAYLLSNSSIYHQAHADSTVVITDVNGAGNMPARVQFARGMLSEVFIVLDKDQAGDHAIDALKESLFGLDNVRQISPAGRNRSALEDLFCPDISRAAFLEVTGLRLPESDTHAKWKMWDDRMKADLAQIGTPDTAIDDKVVELKKAAARRAVADIDQAFSQEGLPIMEGIRAGVERMVQRRESGGEGNATSPEYSFL